MGSVRRFNLSGADAHRCCRGYWFTVKPVIQYQQLQEKAASLEEEIERNSERLNSALWQLYVSDLQLRASSAWAPEIWAMDFMSFGNSGMAVDSMPWPYQNLIDAVDSLRDFYRGPNGYPDQFTERARTFIEAKREFLTCDPPDVSELNEEYRAAIHGLDNRIDARVDGYIASKLRDGRVIDEKDIESYATSIRRNSRSLWKYG